MHPTQRHSTVPSQTKELAISSEEAHKALGIVIRFCEQQPSGFLELQEGVLLGTLDERLRHIRVSPRADLDPVGA